MQLTAIKHAIKKLEASDTPRKRRSATLSFNRALRALQREAREEFPPLRKDGSAIARRKPKGYVCPHCDVPFRAIQGLFKHLMERHGWKPYTCICGHSGNVGRHLAAQKDLKAHCAMAVITNSAKDVR